MIWDDLNTAGMQGAFGTIAREMQSLFGIPESDIGIGLCRGWIGAREPPHPVGFVRKRPPG